MFTAKTLAKAAFIKARNDVAAMDNDSILFEASCNDYELPACIFYRRALRRAERNIYAAQPVINHNDYLSAEFKEGFIISSLEELLADLGE